MKQNNNEKEDKRRGTLVKSNSKRNMKQNNNEKEDKRRGTLVKSNSKRGMKKSDGDQQQPVLDRLYEDAKRKIETRRQEQLEDEKKKTFQKKVVKSHPRNHKRNVRVIPVLMGDKNVDATYHENQENDEIKQAINKHEQQQQGDFAHALETQNAGEEVQKPGQKVMEQAADDVYKTNVFDRLHEDAKCNDESCAMTTVNRVVESQREPPTKSPNQKKTDDIHIIHRLYDEARKTDKHSHKPANQQRTLENSPEQKQKGPVPVLEARKACQDCKNSLKQVQEPKKTAEETQIGGIPTSEVSCESREKNRATHIKGSKENSQNLINASHKSPDQKHTNTMPVLDRLYEDAKRKIEARKAEENTLNECEQRKLEKSPNHKQKGTVTDRLYEDAKRKIEDFRAEETMKKQKELDKCRNGQLAGNNDGAFLKQPAFYLLSLADSCRTLESIPEDSELDTDPCMSSSSLSSAFDSCSEQCSFDSSDNNSKVLRKQMLNYSRKTRKRNQGIQDEGSGSIFDRLHSEKEQWEKKRITERIFAEKEEQKERRFKTKTTLGKHPTEGRKQPPQYSYKPKSSNETRCQFNTDHRNDGASTGNYTEEEEISSCSIEIADCQARSKIWDKLSPKCHIEYDQITLEVNNSGCAIPPSSFILNETFKQLEEAHRALL